MAIVFLGSISKDKSFKITASSSYLNETLSNLMLSVFKTSPTGLVPVSSVSSSNIFTILSDISFKLFMSLKKFPILTMGVII